MAMNEEVKCRPLLEGMEEHFILDDKEQPIPSMRMVRHNAAASTAKKEGYAYRFSRPKGLTAEERLAHRSNKAGLFVAQEMQVAQLATQQLLLEGTLPHGGTIPVLYSPDGGIPTGYGMKRAIDWFSEGEASLYAVVKPSKKSGLSLALPEEALAQARQCGVLVICDSIVDKGRTFTQILDVLPEDFTTAAGEPVKLLFYANVGITQQPDNEANSACYGPVPCMLNAAEVLLNHPRWQTQHAELIVSDVTDNLLQEAERGSAIAKGAHPVTTPFQGLLTRPSRIRASRPLPEMVSDPHLSDEGWQKLVQQQEHHEITVNRER